MVGGDQPIWAFFKRIPNGQGKENIPAQRTSVKRKQNEVRGAEANQPPAKKVKVKEVVEATQKRKRTPLKPSLRKNGVTAAGSMGGASDEEEVAVACTSGKARETPVRREDPQRLEVIDLTATTQAEDAQNNPREFRTPMRSENVQSFAGSSRGLVKEQTFLHTPPPTKIPISKRPRIPEDISSSPVVTPRPSVTRQNTATSLHTPSTPARKKSRLRLETEVPETPPRPITPPQTSPCRHATDNDVNVSTIRPISPLKLFSPRRGRYSDDGDDEVDHLPASSPKLSPRRLPIRKDSGGSTESQLIIPSSQSQEREAYPCTASSSKPVLHPLKSHTPGTPWVSDAITSSPNEIIPSSQSQDLHGLDFHRRRRSMGSSDDGLTDDGFTEVIPSSQSQFENELTVDQRISWLQREDTEAPSGYGPAHDENDDSPSYASQSQMSLEIDHSPPRNRHTGSYDADRSQENGFGSLFETPESYEALYERDLAEIPGSGHLRSLTQNTSATESDPGYEDWTRTHLGNVSERTAVGPPSRSPSFDSEHGVESYLLDADVDNPEDDDGTWVQQGEESQESLPDIMKEFGRMFEGDGSYPDSFPMSLR